MKQKLALLLSLVLMVSFMPVAFADPTDVAYYSATFDGLRTTDLKFASASSNYDNTVKLGGTNGGGVFPTRASVNTMGPVAYDCDGGVDGSGAIVLTAYGNDSTTTTLRTNSVAIPAGGVVEMSYDFCALLPAADYMTDYYITNNYYYGKIYLGVTGSSNEFISIAFVDGAWKFVNADGSVKVAVPLTQADTSGAADASGSYFPDTSWVDIGSNTSTVAQKTGWLRLVVRQLSDGTRTGEVIDLETGNVLFSETVEDYTSSSSCYFDFCRITYFKNAGGESATHYKKATVAFDNATLRVYNPTTTAPEVRSNNVEAEEVARNATFTFGFSQPVSGTVTLKEKVSGNTVTTTTTPLATGELVLSWTGLLAKGKEYEISFENVTNGTLACTTTPITFTTEDLHLWNDVSISPVSAGSGTMSVSFTVSDELEYPLFTGSMLVAAYKDGSLIGVDMVVLTNEDTTQAITKTVNLGTLPQGATLDIILLDVDAGAVPLAMGTTEVQ